MLQGIPALMATSKGVPFVPTSVSGCVMWLAADAIEGLVDGNGVTTWEDGSTANNDATAAVNQPTYKTGIINGLPIVRFNGANNVMIHGLNLSASNYSIFIVVKSITGSVTYETVFQASPSGGNPAVPWVATVGGSLYPNWGALSGSSIWIDSGQSCVGAFKLIETIYSGSGQFDLYTNGTDHISANNGSSFYTDGFNRTYVGADGAAAAFLNGDIAEIIVYNNDVPAASRVLIENYLITKYAL